jgi:hypothetical protein
MADPQVADDDPDRRSDEEASRIRDETLARLLKMPPKPDERLRRGKTQQPQDRVSVNARRKATRQGPHDGRTG